MAGFISYSLVLCGYASVPNRLARATGFSTIRTSPTYSAVPTSVLACAVICVFLCFHAPTLAAQRAPEQSHFTWKNGL